jgi:ferrous iron transport protein A
LGSLMVVSRAKDVLQPIGEFSCRVAVESTPNQIDRNQNLWIRALPVCARCDASHAVTCLQLQASRNSLPRSMDEGASITGRESEDAVALGAAAVGVIGWIRAVRVESDEQGLSANELERRLIELGFVEGARIEILHQGLFGRDPIAVRVNEATIALRRREAASILIEPERK